MIPAVRYVAYCVLFMGLSASCRPPPGPFKVWDVVAAPVKQTVRVKGRFDKEPFEVAVEKLTVFANPVDQNGRAVSDANAHLTGYAMARPEPNRAVRIWNSFGYQNWDLGDAQVLLLPAEKKEPDLFLSTWLEAFVCYAVVSEPAFVTTVSLSDAFDRMRHVTEEVRLHPAFFCTPAELNGVPLQNRKTNLAVYSLNPQTLLDPPIGPIHAEDQVGNHKLTIRKSMHLAVPTNRITVRKK